MHSSLSRIRSRIVFTPRPAKSLSFIDNATPGFILSLEKLSERVPELNWFKIESMMSVRALETKWRILGTHCIVGFYKLLPSSPSNLDLIHNMKKVLHVPHIMTKAPHII